MTTTQGLRPALPRRGDVAVAMLALGLLLAWDLSPLDLWLIRPWGTAYGFAWQDHGFTRQVMHDGGRIVAWAVLIALVVNVWHPLARHTSWFPELSRAERVRWLLVTLVALLAVPAIKQVSLTSCPWELAEFGGRAEPVWHWLVRVPDGGNGHCFPSGHAVSAFAFLSGWFALRDEHPKAARAWLVAVLVLGAVFGWSQMIRGAHYASHTLWSAWLCWALNCVLARRAVAVRLLPKPT